MPQSVDFWHFGDAGRKLLRNFLVSCAAERLRHVYCVLFFHQTLVLDYCGFSCADRGTPPVRRTCCRRLLKSAAETAVSNYAAAAPASVLRRPFSLDAVSSRRFHLLGARLHGAPLALGARRCLDGWLAPCGLPVAHPASNGRPAEYQRSESHGRMFMTSVGRS